MKYIIFLYNFEKDKICKFSERNKDIKSYRNDRTEILKKIQGGSHYGLSEDSTEDSEPRSGNRKGMRVSGSPVY